MTDNNISPFAYHPSNDEFKAPKTGHDDYPNTISEVEHLMRVAFSIGGLTHGLELAKEAIKFQKQHEKDNVFDEFVVTRDELDESNDIWLRDQIEGFHEKIQNVLDAEEKMYERRMDWYDETIPQEVSDKVSRASSMSGQIDFTVMNVVPNHETEIGSDEVRVSALANEIPLENFDIELPQKLVVAESPSSGKLYPFIPWNGALSCTCGYKHQNPVSTLCKHEISALSQYSRDEWDPDGPDIPERYRSLVNQEAYNRFMENINV